jgi:hypothetical protein
MGRTILGFFSWDDGQRSQLAERSLHSVTQQFKNQVGIDIIVLDNGTRSVTECYLKKVDVKKVYFPDNVHDIGLHYLLHKLAMDWEYQYCVPVENDFFFYNPWKLKDCRDFLSAYPDVGACRIQQFEYVMKDQYDKYNPKARQKGQANRMFNCVTGAKLVWQGPFQVGRSDFYVNNWHWVNSPIIVKTLVYQEIFSQIERLQVWPVWQAGEGLLMRCYQKLGLKMGVLDGGCCKHHDQDRGMVESTYRTSPLRNTSVEVSRIVDLCGRWQEYLEC